MTANKDRQPSNPPIMEKDKETVFRLKEKNELEVRMKKKEYDQYERSRNMKLKGYAKEEKQLQKRLHEFNTRISSLAQLDSESSEEGSPLVVRKCGVDQDALKGRETTSPRPIQEKPRLKITLQDLKGKKPPTHQDSHGTSPRSTGSKASSVPPRQSSPITARQQPANRHLDVIRAEIATSNHYLISTPPAVRRRLIALAEKSNTSPVGTKKSTRPAHKTSVRHPPSSTNEDLGTSEVGEHQQQSMPASQALGGSLPNISRQPLRTSCESVQSKGLSSSQEKTKSADTSQEAAQPPSSDGKEDDTTTKVKEWLNKVDITSGKSASCEDIASGEKTFPVRSKVYADLEPPKTAGASLQHKHLQLDVRSASCDNLVTTWKEEESDTECFGEETDFDPEGAYSPGAPADGGRPRFFIHPSTCDEMKPSNVVNRIESTTGKSGIKSWLGMGSDGIDEIKAKGSSSSKDAKKAAGAKSGTIPPDWTM
ncbi:Hypp2743 [Branchiostoma lanceolatum]|uniref:Hypp2743 protein n=1 Tax=Branchiostoma lanceolatum TaxID=7740 RepID=A0A8J9ZVM6_BRALA|nr:Hypp2743 [Branchiostoma lanceolatum]